MKPKPNMHKNKSRDRWSTVEKVVDDALEEMDQKQKDLERFWRDCKRWNPEFFGKMSLEAFESWNHQRLARLDDTPGEQTYNQALAEFQKNVEGTQWPEGHDWHNGAP